MEDKQIKRMQFLAGILKENSKEIFQNQNLKNEIFKVSKEIIGILKKGFDDKKLNLKTKLHFNNEIIEIRLNILKTKIDKSPSITGRADNKGKYLSINIRYPINGDLGDIKDLEDEIKITLIHELKHIKDFKLGKGEYILPITSRFNYFKEEAEIEAHAEEFLLKSELKNIPIENIINQYKDSLINWQKIHKEAYVKVGYKDEDILKDIGNNSDVEFVINKIKEYLNNEYNLNIG